MDTGNGALLSLLTAFVGLIALAMIIQMIAMLVVLFSMRKQAARLTTIVEQANHDIQPILTSAREFLTDGREKFNAISRNVVEITDSVKEQVKVVKAQIARIDGVITDVSQRSKEQVARIDAMITEATDRVQGQFMRLDQMVTDTVSRVEETGEAVKRSVLKPVHEISAILAGVRTGLDFLFRRNKMGVDHATEDEELFI